jgi:outer membrane protein
VGQKQLLAIAHKTLERSRALRAASQAKLEVGKVSQLDVFRARQLEAQAEGQLLDSEGAVEDAMDQMRILLRRGPDYAFEVEEQIPILRPEADAEAAVKAALGARLEITSATESLVEAERAIAASRNQLLPQFDLNLALTRREVAPSLRRSFGLDRFDVATFFAISMPVDRAPQTIEYHSNVIERDRRRREIDALRMRIVEEVRRAVRQTRRLVKALEVADASVEFAEKELDVATLRYQRGFSNNLDVVNAEEGLLGARARRIGLLAEMAVARLSLLAALGTFDPRRDTAAATSAGSQSLASDAGVAGETGAQRGQ